MYWRGGRTHVLLWIASLTLVMSAVAALARAGSSGAALSFLTAGVFLAPPVLNLIARIRHNLAPAKAALYSSITLVPIGLGFVAVDGVATLDREAGKLGFASAGQWARAKDLNLPTPQALAAHEVAERAKAMAAACRNVNPRPIACFEAVHQKAALAYVETRYAGEDLEALVQGALAQQRKTYLALDQGCSDLLDRIDEDAVPAMMARRSIVQAVAAGAWARRFAPPELDQLAAMAKSGASYLNSGATKPLDQKLGVLAPAIEKEIDGALQTWARRIVRDEPSWRAFLKGRLPLSVCAAVQEDGRN
jgi:hypothetical protein